MEQDPAALQQLLQFLKSHDIAALATIREGNAHATTIFYYVEDDLKFYFLTRDETFKFANLKKDARIGLVITDPTTLQTVQVEGIAREADYTREAAGTMEKYSLTLQKNGHLWEKIPLNHMPSTGYYVFVQINPTWIRWTDYTDLAHKVKFEQRYTPNVV